jgi:hypothetical protein
MKKLLLTLTLVLFTASLVSAQTPKLPFDIYIGGGVDAPTTPQAFKDFFKTGVHGSVGIGYSIPAFPKLSIVGKAEYHSFSSDWEQFRVSELTGGDMRVWMFGADVRLALNLPTPVITPYVMAGGGAAVVRFTDVDSTNVSIPNDVALPTGPDETKGYFDVGGGVLLKTGDLLDVFVQARYVHVATSGDNRGFVPVTVGVRF